MSKRTTRKKKTDDATEEKPVLNFEAGGLRISLQRVPVQLFATGAAVTITLLTGARLWLL
ncbi:hypothetical protein ACFU6I_43645 [Streptomyces sp. NPDC057486]|uniref:hypothetical protein n=1 Tax=Streptomyces sp. NPDC057486 TaxID=3346145 RepID=UPI003696BD3C